MAASLLGLIGCESVDEKYGRKNVRIPQPVGGEFGPLGIDGLPGEPSGLAIAEPPRDSLVRPEIHYGTGRRIGGVVGEPPDPAFGELVSLNFVRTGILEVVDVILAETLGLNYVFDEEITGTVTARTVNPVPKSSLIPILENVLALNGAALVQAGGVYNVVPVSAVPSLPKVVVTPSLYPQPPGIGIHIIPLRYASVASVQEIAASLVSPGNQLAVDPARNVLIYTGPAQEADAIADLVTVLDVDLLRGKSFGLFPVQVAPAEDVVDELTMLFTDPALGGVGESASFLPIERLNAILAVTANPAHLDEVGLWIRRLDRTDAEAGRRVFVYYATNSRAADLVDVLGQVFLGEAARRAAPERPPLAPGLEAARIATPQAALATTEEAVAAGPATSTILSAEPVLAADEEELVVAGQDPDQLRIVADTRNNAVVVIATSDEYDLIQATLRQLDVLPLQVLIEATIAEVTLNDELEYGLQWAFENGDISGSLVNTDVLAPAFPGFNLILDTTEVQVILSALAELTEVNVVSSPHMMVLDNQPARLQVGDQVPIAIAEAITDGGTVITSTQYFDTGVILEVVPHVNAAGLVTLEILQEVSDAVPTRTSGIDSPTIQQRRIRSIVSVQSGETIALGGLIRDRSSLGESGIPLLKDIPLLGNAFKTTSNDRNRTELLVLITPRVLRGAAQARQVTDELRKRLRVLAPVVATNG